MITWIKNVSKYSGLRTGFLSAVFVSSLAVNAPAETGSTQIVRVDPTYDVSNLYAPYMTKGTSLPSIYKLWGMEPLTTTASILAQLGLVNRGPAFESPFGGNWHVFNWSDGITYGTMDFVTFHAEVTDPAMNWAILLEVAPPVGIWQHGVEKDEVVGYYNGTAFYKRDAYLTDDYVNWYKLPEITTTVPAPTPPYVNQW